jgi:hypothetical protein
MYVFSTTSAPHWRLPCKTLISARHKPGPTHIIVKFSTICTYMLTCFTSDSNILDLCILCAKLYKRFAWFSTFWTGKRTQITNRRRSYIYALHFTDHGKTEIAFHEAVNALFTIYAVNVAGRLDSGFTDKGNGPRTYPRGTYSLYLNSLFRNSTCRTCIG